MPRSPSRAAERFQQGAVHVDDNGFAVAQQACGLNFDSHLNGNTRAASEIAASSWRRRHASGSVGSSPYNRKRASELAAQFNILLRSRRSGGNLHQLFLTPIAG